MIQRGAPITRVEVPLVTLFLLLAALASPARAGYYELGTPITRFAELGEAVRRESIPLLLVVTDPDCGYCKRQRAEVMEPLGRAGWFDKRAFVREYDWHQPHKVEDFDGIPARGPIFIGRFHLFATPTILFLGPDGEALVPPIVGYDGRETFLALLERSLAASGLVLSKAAAEAADPPPKATP